MQATITLCASPLPMTADLCKKCERNKPKILEDTEFEDYALQKTLMNGWQCDGFLEKKKI